jgi:hypothetical protein
MSETSTPPSPYILLLFLLSVFLRSSSEQSNQLINVGDLNAPLTPIFSFSSSAASSSGAALKKAINKSTLEISTPAGEALKRAINKSTYSTVQLLFNSQTFLYFFPIQITHYKLTATVTIVELRENNLLTVTVNQLRDSLNNDFTIYLFNSEFISTGW